MGMRTAMRVRWSAVCAAGALLLSGCGFLAQDTGAASGGDDGLTVFVNVTPNLTEEFWRDLVAGFEKQHPDVDVTLINQGGRDLGTAFRELVSSGNAPDVAEGLTVTEENAKLFVDLSGHDWAMQTPLAEQYLLDGALYGAAIGTQIQTLVFYNKHAFAEAGIAEPPGSVDELTAAMRKLKGAGYRPLLSAGDFVAGLQIRNLAWPSLYAANPQWYADRAAGRTSFADSAFRDALTAWKSWIDKGYVSKEALGIEYAQAQQQFLNGKAGMWVMGSWFVTAAADAEDFEVGVFPMPTFGGEAPPLVANQAAAWSVLQSSEKKKLATRFVRYMVTNKQALRSQLKADSNFSPDVTYPMSDLGEQIQRLMNDAPAIQAMPNNVPVGFEDEYYERVQGLWLGESPAEILGKLDAWYDEHQ